MKLIVGYTECLCDLGLDRDFLDTALKHDLQKKKIGKLIKFKMSALWETAREWKEKPETRWKYFLTVYAIKDLCPDHMRNSQNAVRRK